MEVDETKFRVPSLFWIPLLVCGALLFFVDVFQIQYYSVIPTRAPIANIFPEEKSLIGFAINTPGCRIPYMDPFDKHIKTFIEKPSVPNCNKGIPALVESNETSISLISSSLHFYNIRKVSDLTCCYQPFWRTDPKVDENDDKIGYYSKCIRFNESANIDDEFITVTCTYNNTAIYKDLFSFVPLKNTSSKINANSPRPINVLVIGLDAVSRLNLHRQMPKTVEYLKEIEALELFGYNKVGDNTFPNLMPVLTGQIEIELRNSCWPSDRDHFDKCHFIWKDYSERGYATVYGEDSSWMGLFNYQRKGFRRQPTDYGYSYFNRLSEKIIGNSHNLNVDECIGARLVYKELLNYIRKFVTTMDKNNLPYFGFFWGASLSHDFLNKPQIGDEDYRNFFKILKDQGHLENTVLFFISDHGIRWGDIRQTYQGRMEERLPFVIIAVPQWFKTKHQRAYTNLLKNTRRLTTPFDLHETLRDLLDPFDLTARRPEKSRGYSLFSEISNNRTCEDAAIESHWCTCQRSLEVEINSTSVIESATFAVKYINSKLNGYAQCAKLSLEAILSARLMTHEDSISSGQAKIRDYMITLRTVPGQGIFEITVRYSEKQSSLKIMGTISRLNLYGNQSSCITDFHLKLYCFCIGWKDS